MKYYPVFMDINRKQCLVVGGGDVGARKAATLERCGAKVRMVSRRFSSRCESLKTTSIDFQLKDYEKKDVTGMFFVFAATDNASLNHEIKKDAEELNILCNIADSPDKSDFILPSVVERGDLIMAVSTSGSSPAMAKKIRQELELTFGMEYAQFLTIMGNIRKKLLSSGHAPDDHRQIFHTLIDRGILNLIKNRDIKKIDPVLHDTLGKTYSYQDLISSGSDAQ